MPALERISYGGWPNCYRLSNGRVELVITADVGPRIIHCGFAGGPNLFATYPDMLGQTGGDEWRIYGGHRLWAAPELQPRTYYPDNAPVAVEQHPGFVRATAPVEAGNAISKEIDIALADNADRATVTHRIRNHGPWAIQLAPWALSVMDAGGTAIVPLPPRGSHPENLLPAHTITLWAYTALSDPRWTLGEKYILLRQDRAGKPQKLGAMISAGWAACAIHDALFLKTFGYVPGAPYPDLNSNLEVFTNQQMLELETLGPLVTLEPGAAVEHVEGWHLFRNVPWPTGDADVDAYILPLARRALAQDAAANL